MISASSRCCSRRWKSKLLWISSGDSASIACTCGVGFAIGQSPATITIAAEAISRPSAGSIPGSRSVMIVPRSETIGIALDLNVRATSADTLRSSVGAIWLSRSQKSGRSARVRASVRAIASGSGSPDQRSTAASTCHDSHSRSSRRR